MGGAGCGKRDVRVTLEASDVRGFGFGRVEVGVAPEVGVAGEGLVGSEGR